MVHNRAGYGASFGAPLRALLAVGALTTGSAAQAGEWQGGGGVVTGFGYYPRYGNAAIDYDAPGGFGCLGGTGFGFRQDGFRVGGELLGCRFRPGVRMGYGGIHLGAHRGLGAFSWGLGATVGLGALSDDTGGVGDYDAFFGYIKPEARIGFNFGFSGVELALHAMTPVHLAQWDPAGQGRGIVTPTVGFEARFLFGNLWVRRDRWDAAPTAGPQDDRPLAVPGPSTPPPPPQDYGDVEGLPLAIPAEEASYPAPPPPQGQPPEGPGEAPLAIPADGR